MSDKGWYAIVVIAFLFFCFGLPAIADIVEAWRRKGS